LHSIQYNEEAVDGIMVPVFDEQLNSIIAYSLASIEYSKQFKHFSKAEGRETTLFAFPPQLVLVLLLHRIVSYRIVRSFSRERHHRLL